MKNFPQSHWHLVELASASARIEHWCCVGYGSGLPGDGITGGFALRTVHWAIRGHDSESALPLSPGREGDLMVLCGAPGTFPQAGTECWGWAVLSSSS